MNRYRYLELIAAKIKEKDSPLYINVAHKGRYNGVHMYMITPHKWQKIGHKWHEKGNLLYMYRKYVGKGSIKNIIEFEYFSDSLYYVGLSKKKIKYILWNLCNDTKREVCVYIGGQLKYRAEYWKKEGYPAIFTVHE